jgi:23S rRNA (uracil1939-C5)-methyltransferase
MIVRFFGLAFGGEGVGKAEAAGEAGRVVFAPFAAPGDVAEVRVTQTKQRFLRGEIVRTLEAGPSRTEAPCPYFARCGGCQWQHVTRAAQLAAKQAIVERALGTQTEAITSPGPDYGYRWRVRQHWKRRALGYHEWRSQRILDVERCLLLPPSFDAAIQGSRPTLREEAELHAQMGTDGAVAIRCGSVALGPQSVDIADTGEPPFWVAPGGFAQPGPNGNRLLRKLVRDGARVQGKRVLELYAGAGNFTRDLVAQGGDVTAVESSPPKWFVPGAQLRVSTAEKAVRAAEAFDVVVLDPPREGAREVCRMVGRLGAERIVYVSCDPMTLARDVKLLAEQGYSLERVHVIDLMPQTFHVETIVVLVR